MAEWPDAEELKRVVNFDPETEADELNLTLDRALAAAIIHVKLDVGDWDEDVDVPTDNLAHAALRAAELIARRPEGAAMLHKDPTYMFLIYGTRRSFGVA